MTLSAARVSSRTKFLLGAMAAAALALAPQAMLAQHGGGGGHFGGGGGHFGGAASGSHSSPAPASHSSSKPSAPVRPPWAPTNVHNSVSAASRPALSSPFAESPAPEGIARGDAAISAEPSPALPHTTTIGFPRSAAPGAEQWQVVTPSRGGVLSFSGQGHDIWQNSPGVTSPGTAARGAVAGSRPAVNELSTHPRMFPPTRFYPNPILYGPGYGFFGPGFGFDIRSSSTSASARAAIPIGATSTAAASATWAAIAATAITPTSTIPARTRLRTAARTIPANTRHRIIWRHRTTRARRSPCSI